MEVYLTSPGAQSPGLGCPLKNASASSGSRADNDLSSALNSRRLGLSGSRRLGEPKDLLLSVQTLPGADREQTSVGVERPFDKVASDTSLSGNAK